MPHSRITACQVPGPGLARPRPWSMASPPRAKSSLGRHARRSAWRPARRSRIAVLHHGLPRAPRRDDHRPAQLRPLRTTHTYM